MAADHVELAKQVPVTRGFNKGKTLGDVMATPKGTANLTWIRDNCQGSDGAGAAILLKSMLI